MVRSEYCGSVLDDFRTSPEHSSPGLPAGFCDIVSAYEHRIVYGQVSVSIVPSVLLLTAHLLAMQVAGAGPLVAVLLDKIGGRHCLLERLTRVSWWSFWIGILLGGALTLTQVSLVDRDYGPAIEMLAYKLQWGVLELLVFAMSLWAYLWGWRRLRSSRARRGWHRFLGIFTATNLLYHFPTLMLLFSRIVEGRLETTEPISAASYRGYAFGGDVFAATVHFWLASLVTAGIVVALLAIQASGREEGTELGSTKTTPMEATRRVGLWGNSIALIAAMLQLPVGMWLLSVLPGDEQARVLGNDWKATGLLAVAIVLAFGLLHDLASIAFGSWGRPAVRRCAAKLCVLTLAMVAASMRLGG